MDSLKTFTSIISPQMSGSALLTIFVLFVSLLLPFTASAQDKVLNILYTGAIRGELEPCGCSPETQSGGLARLSGYVADNKAALSPYVMVDAGDTLGSDTPQGRLKAEALIRSFGIIGYDAVFLGKPAFPEDFVAPLVKENKIQVISEKGGNKAITVARGGFKVNISTDTKGYKKGMLNILLTDLPIEKAKAVRGWDVIASSIGEPLEEPVRVKGTIIVAGAQKGRRLGVLTIGLDKKGRPVYKGHRWQELGKDIKEDVRVRGVLNEYDTKVAALLKDEERKVSENGPYLGDKSCIACHQPFVESWSRTRHAKAFKSLEDVGKSKDPECVKCHVVGFGEEGGFFSVKATPELKNVQCEACHGPGKEHVRDFSVPMRPVGEQTCIKCHTPENSPSFDYKRYFEKIKHN